MKSVLAGLLCLAVLGTACGAGNALPLIDAHSQFDDEVPADRVIDALARAGVAKVILSARGQVQPATLAELGAAYPECILPAVRTKSRAFDQNRPGYYRQLNEQLGNPAFKAMSEIILVHAPKGDRAPEVNLEARVPQVQEAIRQAIAKGWPVILHYEFRWLARYYGAEARDRRMAELTALLGEHPDHPFGLIHMGQLDAAVAAELLAAHANLFLLTSHANPVVTRKSAQPWTDMFVGDDIAPDWAALMQHYPDRFVLAIDNVWPEHWTDLYARQMALWRQALAKLPDPVAQAVAHGNAQRLWKLQPATASQGCAAPR